MYSKVSYTIVGIFVVLFGAGLVGFAFWLANYGIEKEFNTYKLYMEESVSGLSKDSTVKLRGVDIGRVSAIRINPKNIEQIEVYLKIKRDVPIKENMIAYTQMLGITGLLFIEIGGGTNEAKTLKPTEDYIPIIRTAPSWFSKTKEGLGTLSDKILLLVEQTQKLLSDKNIENISKSIENIEKMTAKGDEVETKITASLGELDVTLNSFRESVKQMEKDFSVIKKVTVPTIDALLQTSKDFKRVTIKVEKSIDRGDYNLKKIFEPLLVDMGILSQQVNDLAQELKENPNDILFKSREARRGPGE